MIQGFHTYEGRSAPYEERKGGLILQDEWGGVGGWGYPYGGGFMKGGAYGQIHVIVLQ